MSETSETAQPRRWRVAAPFIQYRAANTSNRRIGGRLSPWFVQGAHQGAILTETDVHPDDMAHLKRAKLTDALGSGPFLEEVS